MTKDILMMVAFLAAWFVLSRWVLPAMGVPTCMSGQCPTSIHRPAEQPAQPSATVDEEAERLGVNRFEVEPLPTNEQDEVRQQ